jgi:hypothetical protein
MYSKVNKKINKKGDKGFKDSRPATVL